MEYHHNTFGDDLNDSIPIDSYLTFDNTPFLIDDYSQAPSSPAASCAETESGNSSSMPSPGSYAEPSYDTDSLPDLFPSVFDQVKPDPELSLPSSLCSSPTVMLSMDAMETESSMTCAVKRGSTTASSSRSKKRAPATPSPRKRTTRQPTKKQKVESKPNYGSPPQSFADSLKGKTSGELERLIEQQQMSMNEQEILKKQIRVMKNRESAQLSRERRKVYQEELETRYTEESARSVALKQQILELEAESKVLQGELAHFNNLIKRSNLGKAFESTQNNAAFQALSQSAATNGDPASSSMFFVYLMMVLQTFGQQLYSFGPIQDPHALISPPAPIEAKA